MSVIKNSDLLIRINKISSQANLNQSTKDFLSSLQTFAIKSGGLTQAQLSSFEKIESCFSPQAVAQNTLWAKEYDQQKKKNLKIVAAYYAQTKYYTSLAKSILNNDSFIPTADQYKRLVENKYAQKILEETIKEPKFSIGSLVSVKGIPFNNKQSFLAFVQQSNAEPISSACRGAKKYRIMPFGFATTIIVEERYMKKGKDI